GEGHVETVGTDDVDRGEADDVDDNSAVDIGSASVPVITGLVPTPTRWPVEGEDAAAPMRRPSIPGVPVASTQDDDADPASEVDISESENSEGSRSEDRAASSSSDDAGTTPVAPQVQAGSLITDTGSIRLPGETMLLGAGTSHASLDTGSVPVFAGGIELDVDLEDDVDDVAEPVEVLAADGSALPIAPAEAGDLTGLIVPISTAALIGVPAAATVTAPAIADEAVNGHASADAPAPDRAPAPAPRAADDVDAPVDSLEPTPQDLRVAGAGRQFWMWLAPNTSALTLGLGAVLLGSGLSARQSILATVVGLLLAALPLGLTTLAVARSGQPSAVVSRASFGTAGNIVPTILLLIVRLFWIAMLLWLLATSVDSLVFESGYDLFVDPAIAAIVALGLLGAGATVVAAFGLAVITRVQAILTVLAVVSVGALVAATASRLDLDRITGSVDGDAFTVVAGAMIVLALLGTAWAGIGGDIARRQRSGGSGAAVAASTGLGATLPALVLITWGALLAASDDALSVGLQTDPVATIAQSVPGWYPLPLLLAVSAAILAGISTMGYSGGLTLMALGVPVSRLSATILVMLVGVAGGGAILAIVPGLTPMLVDIVPALAVPVLAWAGIVATEVLLRRRPLDARSLLSRGGAYPAVRWGNLGALAVITVIGWGLLSPSQGWFEAEGYLWRILGIDTDAGLGATDIGVAAALVLGMLTPLVLGIAAIRRQEGGEVVDRPVRLGGSSPVVAPLEG
ncbi:MAG: cytosine permease, partial [Naasia sp.]